MERNVIQYRFVIISQRVRIQDGKAVVDPGDPEKGASAAKVGMPAYYLANFTPKL